MGRLKGPYELHQRALLYGMSPRQDLRNAWLADAELVCEFGLGTTAHGISESFDLGGADCVLVGDGRQIRSEL